MAGIIHVRAGSPAAPRPALNRCLVSACSQTYRAPVPMCPADLGRVPADRVLAVRAAIAGGDQDEISRAWAEAIAAVEAKRTAAKESA